MSANNDLQSKLQAGIEAVRSGDRTTGRRLLEEVIAEDANNELAWMWLASAVTTLSERRTCLQKALQINPNNQRAREALKRLQGERQQAEASDSARQFEQIRQAQRSVRSRGRDDNSTSEGGGRSLPFVSMGTLMIVGLVILGVVGVGLIGSVVFAPAPTPTPAPVILPTSRPTNTPVPTATSFIVDANAITRSAATLPPTFTPTATFTPTITLTPSPTPFPPSIFDALYTSREVLSETADIYAINGDGSGERRVVEAAWDIAYGWDGNFIAYAKDVTYPADDDVPEDTTVSEIFYGPANAPEAAEQVTRLRVRNAYSPTISPTGRQIVFVSDWDGDDDLWLLDLDSGATSQLTFNDYIDRDPHWSPDGSRLIFTSDRDTPGFTDIYTLTFVVVDTPNPDESPHIVERLNNAAGSSYSPRWSPDGLKIVFINDRGGDGDVYIMDADGQRSTLITVDDGAAEDRSPDFSPDGRLIGFVSNREDNLFQVYLINRQGRELTRIIDNSREAESIRFKPDVQLLFPGA